MSRDTIRKALREIREGVAKEGQALPLRQAGPGRKRLTIKDKKLLEDLESLVDPVTRGDPQSALRWTCKSVSKLTEALQGMGHEVSDKTVERLLKELHYSLQANQKTKEGTNHPDRDAQFAHINDQVKAFQAQGQPVISVDTKKKELVGDFKNAGREWQPKGQPEEVRVHDFEDKALGKAVPYGVYDLSANAGWVSVGTDHDTAEFAVESIRRWWHTMGQQAYPQAQELLITADSGGSNSYRTRLWKTELQALADETGHRISVCHLPPGTSKWNKIEHRMFSSITENWRGRPLVSHEVIVNLIGNTTTKTGLKIRSAVDRNHYEKGIKIADDELAKVRLQPDAFHGEWNYTIAPREEHQIA